MIVDKRPGAERYDFLADIVAQLYQDLLEFDPGAWANGEGNCWVVAMMAYGAAEALGLHPRLCGGQVFELATGKRKYSSGGHYWVELDHGIIFDSPQADLIVVGTAVERDCRYVAVRRTLDRRGADMKRAQQMTRARLTATVRKQVLARKPDLALC